MAFPDPRTPAVRLDDSKVRVNPVTSPLHMRGSWGHKPAVMLHGIYRAPRYHTAEFRVRDLVPVA